jgi:hypothetical protein
MLEKASKLFWVVFVVFIIGMSASAYAASWMRDIMPRTTDTYEIGNITYKWANSTFSQGIIIGDWSPTIGGAMKYASNTFSGYNGTDWVVLGIGSGVADTTCNDGDGLCSLVFYHTNLTDASIGGLNSSDWTNVTILESQISDLTHTTDTDTDTNVSSICGTGNHILLQNGSCVPDTNYLDDTTIADTDTNASACATGELLDGDNNCVTYTAWDYNEVDDFYTNGSKNMTGSINVSTNITRSVGNINFWWLQIFVQTVTSTTGNFAILNVAGNAVLHATTAFGGDLSGTYDAIVVADNSHNHSCLNTTDGSDTDYCVDADTYNESGDFQANIYIVNCTENQIWKANAGGDMICSADADSGGGGASKWVDAGSYLYPNGTFANNTLLRGYINSTDWSNASYSINQTGIPYTSVTGHPIPVDTDTNVSSICGTGNHLLLQNGSCVPDTNYLDNVDIDTDTNVTSICTGAQFLLANGSCPADTNYLDDTVNPNSSISLYINNSGTPYTSITGHPTPTDTDTNVSSICSSGNEILLQNESCVPDTNYLDDTTCSADGSCGNICYTTNLTDSSITDITITQNFTTTDSIIIDADSKSLYLGEDQDGLVYFNGTCVIIQAGATELRVCE